MSSSGLIDAIVDSQKEFVGEKGAIAAARRAPLEIDHNGEIQEYYGKEDIVVEILLDQYYSLNGEAGLRYIKKYLAREDMEIPEDVDMPERKSVMESIMKIIRGIVPV